MELTEFRALGKHVADEQAALIEEATPDEEMRRAIANRAAKRSAESRGGWRQYSAAAAFAIVGIGGGALASLGLSGAFSEDPLTFTVGESGAPGVLSEWTSAADEKLPLRFSDGTDVVLEKQARGRVVSIDADGAELVIESGEARFDVVHREKNDWRVRTGPFVVQVTGTKFDVGWDPQADEFTLTLFEGSVLIQGCSFGDGHPVKAGQTVRASCGRNEMSVGAYDATAKTEEPETAAPKAEIAPKAEVAGVAAAPEATNDEGGSASPKPARVAAKPVAGQAAGSWQTLAKGGHFRQAYARAAEGGFEAHCQRSSAAELLLLGDAARLSGRSDHAHHAYSMLRRRFSGSSAAARAAFALGRSAFHAGNSAGAAQWFQIYLSEQPGGPLASVALGRVLEASVRLGDSGRARSVAKSYLERYPTGAHADAARKVLGSAPASAD